MKNRFVISVLVIMMSIGGALFTRAMAFPGGGGDPPGAGQGFDDGHMRPRIAAMAKALNLSDDQVAQIKAIHQEEWQGTQDLRQQLRENRQKLHELAWSGSFDESQVRALAEKQSTVRTELLVHRARVQNKVYNVLTPAQREEAAKMGPGMWQGRGRHGKSCK
jgi:Spy/CpxP family protein refolding chaperone